MCLGTASHDQLPQGFPTTLRVKSHLNDSVQGLPPPYKASATSQQIYLRNVSLWDWLQDFSIREQCPTFLAPGTSFVEDNFSMDRAAAGWEWGWFRDDSSV